VEAKMICNGIELRTVDIICWLLMLVLGTWKCIDLIHATPLLVEWLVKKIEQWSKR